MHCARNSKTMNFGWGAPLIPSYKPSKVARNEKGSDKELSGMESIESLRASGSESLVGPKHSLAGAKSLNAHCS